jgi:hypothetical protein
MSSESHIHPIEIGEVLPANLVSPPEPVQEALHLPGGRSHICADYLSLPREAETWLIRPLIPTGGAVNVYGDAKVGKSFATAQLCAALSGALPNWLGFPIDSTGPVLYVQLDTPRNLWMERIEAMNAGGVNLERIHFADRESLDTWPFNIANPDHYRKLRAEVDRIQPVATVIDTLKEAHSADENSSTEMQQVIAALTSATKPGALSLVSHSRKAQMESGPDLINDQRGSNYVSGRMDAIIRFTKKHVIYTGRACEEGSIKLRRMECGAWEPEQDEFDAHLRAILEDPSYSTRTDKAKALAARTGKTIDACMSQLRRNEGKPKQRALGDVAVRQLSAPDKVGGSS